MAVSAISCYQTEIVTNSSQQWLNSFLMYLWQINTGPIFTAGVFNTSLMSDV